MEYKLNQSVDLKSKSLFARLKRLFSTDVIVRNVGGKLLKIKDTDQVQYATDRNSLKDRFNRIRTSGHDPNGKDYSLAYLTSRIDLFRDYDFMDADPILSSALDIYADECLTENEMGNMLTVKASDGNIKKILENLFYDILNVEFNMWSWTRNMCKYGDFYLKLHISPEYGVHFVEPISSYNVTRIEKSDPLNKNYIKYQINFEAGSKEELENYQVAHFRLISDSNFMPYGKCLRGESKIWTPNGYKEIKDMVAGDEVYSFDTDSKELVKTKVLNQLMSGIKKVYEVKTAHRTLYASYEHPLMMADGTYKSVKNLSLSDYLVLPVNNNEVGEIPNLVVLETDDWKFDKKLIKIDELLLKNNISELVRFFGFMLGDGWLDKSNKTVCFSIGDRLDKSKQYVEFIEKLGLSYRLTNEWGSDSNCVIHSVYFYKLFEQLGFKTGTENKVVPDWVWKLSKHIRREIFLGFGDADGCDFILNEAYQVGTINKNLIVDLREIAMNCGFSTTKMWDAKGDNKRMYYFTFRKDSRDFKKIDDNHSIEKIRSVTEVGSEEVYDIQVASKFSNFVADGVVVHNSMIEGARRVWKQLSLMEDAMLIHRIMRAPEKRVFKIDVGNIPPAEVDNFMERTINKMKKIPYMDEKTGDYNLRFNLQNMVEDFYLPVRGSDSGASIESISGMEFTGTDDIEYLRNKLMAALKIPKAFLGYEAELSGKATLAAEDVRFARTIQRIQKILVSELSKIAVVHLYSQGYKDASLVDFSLELTNPSTIFEKEKIVIWGDKVNVAKDMMDNKLFSKEWIYSNIFNMSEDDILDSNSQIVSDVKQSWRLKQIEDEGNDPAVSLQKVNVDGELENAGEESSGGGMGGGLEEPPSDSVGGDGGKPESEEKPDVKKSEKDPSAVPLDEKSKKPYVRPSQRGVKRASDYPFGEDPLGSLENNANYRKNPIRHKYKNDSPLGFESMNLGKMSTFLNQNPKKELIRESKQQKSIMDESNIL